MQSKKVILFIVEGRSDETALKELLCKVFKDKLIHFHVVKTDLTSDIDSTHTNIYDKILDCVTIELNRKKFFVSDIERIVHIIDTDGAFIPDSAIVQGTADKFNYTSTTIEAKNIQHALDRNNRKKSIIKKLITTEKLEGFIDCEGASGSGEYKIYYLSRNLEHCFYNIQHDMTNNDKMELADEFYEKYIEKISDFVIFLNNSSFTASGTYEETWDFIQTATNSLERYSNLHLFVGEQLP